MPEPDLQSEIARLHGLFASAAEKAKERRWLARMLFYSGLVAYCEFQFSLLDGGSEAPQETNIKINDVETNEPDVNTLV